MERLIIDRQKWYRGHEVGSKLLRAEDGKMCCLGFDLLRRGFIAEQIMDISVPEDVEWSVVNKGEHSVKLDGLAIYCDCENPHASSTKVCDQLVSTNDDETLSESDREAKITRLFAGIGVTVEFVN